MTRRAEVIRQAIQAAVDEIRVALPGVVESVNISAQTADVRPLLLNRLVDDSGTVTQEELPVLPSVPIGWQRAGGFFVTMPITKGDTGLIVFPDWSLDQWRAKGGSIPVDPLDVRSHSLTSAVFYPGLHSKTDALSSAHDSNMVMGDDDGSQIHIKPGGEIHLGSESASDFVALAQKVLTELQNVQAFWAPFLAIINGPPITEPGMGSPSALQIALAAALVPVTPYPTPASVASTKVKAD